MDEVKIALYSLKMSIRGRMQYRLDSLVATLAVFIREATNIIVIYLTLLKFDSINSWNIYEMLFQLILNNADVLAVAGHGLLGILLIQGGIFIFLSALSFYFVETNSIREIFYWNMRKFVGYPISIYNKVIQTILIYIIPFAFVNYFPAQYLLRKEDMVCYNEVYMYIPPLVGLGIYLLAYAFWRISVRRYTSTGN